MTYTGTFLEGGGHLFDTSDLTWDLCKKTKGLRAKPVCGLVNDLSVMSKFVMVLIDTLEGEEPIDPRNMFCIGEAGDAWQQNPVDLLAKYDLIRIDEDGWLHFLPKPGNVVECYELLAADCYLYGTVQQYIQGRYGKTVGKHENLQKVDPGDFICRNPQLTTDQWVVRRKLFNNTYGLL